MMYFKSIFLSAAMALALAACSGNQNQDGHDHHNNPAGTTEVKAHGTGKEHTSAYVCPMHCQGSGSDQPGKCPVCGMDYVTQADHVKDGHQH